MDSSIHSETESMPDPLPTQARHDVKPQCAVNAALATRVDATDKQYESGSYRINGIQVMTTSAATEGKVALLDMSKVNVVFL